jgi:hypothetical protein
MNRTKYTIEIDTPLREHEKAQIRDVIRAILQLKFVPEVLYITYEKEVAK